MSRFKTAAIVAGAGMILMATAMVRPADAAPGEVRVATSKVGDRDNFGYGPNTGPPPCEYFDNREGDDLPGFDSSIRNGDEAVGWTHTFSPVVGATRVQLVVWEIFADGVDDATITVDGSTFDFIKGSSEFCVYPEGGFKRYFQLRGAAAAAAAADGEVVVTFNKNGDDLAFDRAVLYVYAPVAAR